jgi:hypothetical protein
LIECLLKKGVLSGPFIEQLARGGIDLAALARCVEAGCNDTPWGRDAAKEATLKPGAHAAVNATTWLAQAVTHDPTGGV